MTTDSPRASGLELPPTMRAIVLDHFGGADALKAGEMPVPDVGPSTVLIRVAAAGIGSWDPFEREGGYAQMLGLDPDFPYVLGSEGAGTVVATGSDVDHLQVGDSVFGAAFLDPAGGFYAAYTAVDEALVAEVPSHLAIQEAAGLAGVGMTALRGIDDVLDVAAGERLAIVGASGAIGHLAVQLAAARRIDVLAIASGPDGVELCDDLGATKAIDGHHGDVAAAIARFAPDGLDAALLLTAGQATEATIEALAPIGRAGFPSGVEITSTSGALESFDGEPDRDIIQRLVGVVNEFDIVAHIHECYGPDHIARAHAALDEHHLGKLILDARPLHDHDRASVASG